MSGKNIYLFTGEEKFLIFDQLNKWKDSFVKKYGKENFFNFKSDEIKEDILNVIFGGSLLSTKKLIYIFGLPEDTDATNKVSKDISKILQSIEKNWNLIGQDTVLVFVSFKPDKRKSFYKFLVKNAVVKEFKKLSDTQLINFVKSYVDLPIEVIQYFILKVGTDLFRLHNELKKLQAYLHRYGYKGYSPEQLKQLIDQLIYITEDIDLFKILDKILLQKENLIQDIDKLKNEDVFKFLGLMFWGIKTSIQIVKFYQSGIKNSKQIASKLGVHPFVVSNRLKNIDNILKSYNFLENLFEKLFELEINLKTGKINSELFWREFKNIILKKDEKIF